MRTLFDTVSVMGIFAYPPSCRAPHEGVGIKPQTRPLMALIGRSGRRGIPGVGLRGLLQRIAAALSWPAGEHTVDAGRVVARLGVAPRHADHEV
jgi:hypothetical protein